MANESSSKSSGIGLTGVLFVVFLVLKLCHVIDWSWWWVTAPLWIPVANIVVILMVYALYKQWVFYKWKKMMKKRTKND